MPLGPASYSTPAPLPRNCTHGCVKRGRVFGHASAEEACRKPASVRRAALCRSSTDSATATPSTAEPRLRPRRCAVTAVELVNESYSLESPAQAHRSQIPRTRPREARHKKRSGLTLSLNESLSCCAQSAAICAVPENLLHHRASHGPRDAALGPVDRLCSESTRSPCVSVSIQFGKVLAYVDLEGKQST